MAWAEKHWWEQCTSVCKTVHEQCASRYLQKGVSKEVGKEVSKEVNQNMCWRINESKKVCTQVRAQGVCQQVG